MAFEAQRWRQAGLTFESDTRERMAADLLQHQSLIGRSRSDVIAQLGEPDITDVDGGPLSALLYDIRVDYGYDIDPIGGTYLVVEFGPDGRVNKVRTKDWKLRD